MLYWMSKTCLLTKFIKVKCDIIEHWVWRPFENAFWLSSIVFFFDNTFEVISLQKCFELQKADQEIVLFSKIA